jgi:signal transduction histidine kinase
MLHSLRFRLLLSLVVVIGAALGIIALYASRVTTSEFERSVVGILRYQDPRLEVKIITIQKTINQLTGESAIWFELQDLLEQMGASSRSRFVLADLYGTIYADSEKKMIGYRMDTKQSKPIAVYLIEGTPILMYFEPLDVPNLAEIGAEFSNSVNRSLLLAIFGAGSLALLVTLLLSRSILQPVDALTKAVRRMGSGDLSQRVEIDTKGEVGELAEAFNTMVDNLERLELLRRTMVTDVAHELRTPLSNVRGYLEAIQDDMVQPSREVIDSLHEETMLLNRLVNDLQELSLVEAGKLHIEVQALDLRQIVQRAITLAQPTAIQKNLTLRTRLPQTLPMVLADPERLGQILHNLLDNAIHYTPEAGQISIIAEQQDGFIEIRVEDTGSGISAEHLPHIFERFYRADQSRSRKTGGAGLGLAIVKHLVEAQGGQVSARSQAGQGTTISFTLPVIQLGFGTAGDEAALTVSSSRPKPPLDQHSIL